MAPPGRQKSECEFCLFGGGFLRPMRRAACRGDRSCAACRCCEDFCARCPGVFSAGVLLSCPRLAGSLLLLCLACAAGACSPFVCHALVCAGLLLPLFGLFGSLHRGAGRCRRPAAVREASRRCAVLRLCFRPSCSAAFAQAFVPAALFAFRVLSCARLFFYLLPFSASLLPLKNFFTCRSGRDGPLLSSEKKVDKDSQKGFAPSNPIPAP